MPDPTPPAPPATPPVTPPATPPVTPPTGSAMGTVAEKPEDWIPEPLRVKGADGQIDEGKSARAIAKAYAELKGKMVDTGLPPESADKYELEGPKGFDIAEFRKDPSTVDFLKGAHSQGMTNKQLNYVINKYLETAPAMVAASAQLSHEDFMTELTKFWPDPQERLTNIRAGLTAGTKFAESMGLKWTDFEAAGLGDNPMFARIMATLAKQIGEDGNLPSNVPMAGTDFDSQKAALDAELAGIPERDVKKREAVLAKITALYNKRFPSRQPAPAVQG